MIKFYLTDTPEILNSKITNILLLNRDIHSDSKGYRHFIPAESINEHPPLPTGYVSLSQHLIRNLLKI